jgi:aubergine-like protein
METEIEESNNLQEIKQLNQGLNRLNLVGEIKHNTGLRQKCRPTQIICNYKRINMNNFNVNLRILSIKFEPEINVGGKLVYNIISSVSRQLRERIGKFMQQGNILISTTKLTEPFEIIAEPCSRSNNVRYKIIISPSNSSFDFSQKNMDGEEEDDFMLRQKKQFLEKIISSILNANKSLIRFNKKSYCDVTKLDPNLRGSEPQVLPGYNTSVIVTRQGAFLKICAKNKMINNQTCYELLSKMSSESEMKEAFCGKSVLANYGTKRVYLIDDIAFDKNVTNTFIQVKSSKEAETLSLQQYYKRTYDKDIKQVNQPLFVCRKKDRLEKITECYLIPELMLPTGIDESTKQGEGFNKAQNKTRMKPQDKMNQFNSFCNYLNSKTQGVARKKTQTLQSAQEVKESWGLDLANNFETFRTRELLTPNLNYANSSLEVKDGKFRPAKVLECTIRKWGFICERKNQNVDKLLGDMQAASNQLGITLSQPMEFELGNSREWLEAIKSKRDNFKGLDIILVMLNNNNAQTYKTIKTIFYQRLGIPCQCIVPFKHNKGLSSISNVLNQMVVKCKGRLYDMSLGEVCPTMNLKSTVLGVEVVKSGKFKKYSMVGTMNKFHNKIITDEVLRDPGDKACFPINNFVDNILSQTGFKEATIVIYRNGSNSSQTKSIVDEDILPLRMHLDNLKKKGYAVTCAFIITNKLIDVKFFAVDGNNLNNPKSGLCVDDHIISPGSYEFYIQPQYVNMGTATPTRFQVLMDDTKMSLEEIEQITYYMCYYYWNWAGAIRVPAVLKYSEVYSKFSSTVLSNANDLPVKDNIKNSPFFI